VAGSIALKDIVIDITGNLKSMAVYLKIINGIFLETMIIFINI